jgi:putative ABC transport system permease protein
MRIPYSLKILWRDRSRYLPAILAVTFSAVLIAVQFGVLVGILALASRPIDRAHADIWVGSQVDTFGMGHPIPLHWQNRLQREREIAEVESYLIGYGMWHKPSGGTDQCYIIGARLRPGALGMVRDISPAMRRELSRTGTVATYASDIGLLGLHGGTSGPAELNDRRVEVVEVMRGHDTKTGLMAGVYGSQRTARHFLPGRFRQDQCSYLLARCQHAADAKKVVERLSQRYPDMEVLTNEDFSLRTRLYWLTKTKAGLAMAFGAVLGLVVGALITSQTLYAAAIGSLREYAVLQALGIRRQRVAWLVLAQSGWLAFGGVALALPVIFAFRFVAVFFGIEVMLPLWLMLATMLVTVAMALLSGLSALRSLQMIELALLLR